MSDHLNPPDAPTGDTPPPHAFRPEGQVASHLSADRCVICGLPEAAHRDDTALAELRARFGPTGWEIQPNPGGVAVWLAIKKNGSSTRVIAAYGPGELYAKLQAADQKDLDEGRPLT
jgi:hypothetical protein